MHGDTGGDYILQNKVFEYSLFDMFFSIQSTDSVNDLTAVI